MPGEKEQVRVVEHDEELDELPIDHEGSRAADIGVPRRPRHLSAATDAVIAMQYNLHSFPTSSLKDANFAILLQRGDGK